MGGRIRITMEACETCKETRVRPEDRLTMSRANRYYVAEDHGWCRELIAEHDTEQEARADAARRSDDSFEEYVEGEAEEMHRFLVLAPVAVY